jgi:hypothetical protein
MKQWDQIYEFWNKLEVPEVKIIDFETGINTIDSPWFSIQEKKQVNYLENPMRETAYHLCICLKDKNPELIAAYKILAYLWSNRQKDLLYDSLSFAMKKYNERTNSWWSLNAVYILPYCNTLHNSDFRISKLTDKDWDKIVTNAAKEWTAIANEWAIIRIPKFMDRDSDEYKLFETYSESVHEQREYQEYLRLKKKFEKE